MCPGRLVSNRRAADRRAAAAILVPSILDGPPVRVKPVGAGVGRWQAVARPAPCGPEKATPLKQIVAVVKPYLVERVLENLKRAPLEACTVREVKGYGRQKSYLDQYAGSEYALAFLPKVEIELWVDDSRVDEIVRKIVEVARTGRMGDGKIFVLPAAIPGAVAVPVASAKASK